MIDPAFNTLIAWAFVLLFASAAATKLLAFRSFTGALADYQVVPRPTVLPVACVLTAIEFCLALGLAAAGQRAACAIAGSVLLSLYGVAILANLHRGRRHIDCGCGAERQPIGRWMVVRNFLLAAALLVAALPVTRRVPSTWDTATIGAGLAALMMLYASFNFLMGGRDSHHRGIAEQT
jgi:hypothetical protein